ncbi:HET-domain-containing protein [Periconia macrospinosa]|uniref:HET-domain-containing protein n=1 Tax=Periconia macrospinosa TaxID=97972 RepID=A0A2V1DFX1_9PLEO|nr:HET-domain-containing protein [Periconia macrospinosa]
MEETLAETHTNHAPLHILLQDIIRRHLREQPHIDPEKITSWTTEYDAFSGFQLDQNLPLVQDVLDDTIDTPGIEACISELRKGISLHDQFCDDCQYLFDNWPTTRVDKLYQNDPHNRVAVGREYHTVVLEAAARNGCRFCAYLIQTLRDNDLLELFRKIERRLVGRNYGGATLLVEHLGTWGSDRIINQYLWVNLPGKQLENCHCWGREPFLQLVAHNYEQFCVAIPMEELPKTFQDAIRITRSLGIDYIWIDSLCIIQEDVQDWEREASTMSGVYGGSYINIAASTSKNAHGGMFTKPEFFVDGLRVRVLINGIARVKEVHHTNIYESHVTESHLATRAWTLQEKLLPTRTLHIGDRGAFWECNCDIANEGLPLGIQHPVHTRLKDQQRSDLGLSVLYRWHHIVKVYSAANLTYTKDKLPALSGVARHLSQEHNFQYLAGIWRDNTVNHQLCWKALHPNLRSDRSPSWSWTSIDGLVDFRMPVIRVLDTFPTRIIEAKMDLETEDPFGSVRGGLIRVACLGLLPAQLQSSEGSEFPFIVDIGLKEKLPIRFDFLNNGFDNEDEKLFLLPITHQHDYAFQDTFDDKGEPVWIDCFSLEGLVLRQIFGRQNFERTGHFSLSSHREKNENLPSVESFIEAYMQKGHLVAEQIGGTSLKDDRYPSEEHPYPWYVVDII